MIYTFYSFKGGVGRSMALASVAYLLAARGMRVLVVDFDLEAPGLERYFFESDAATAAKARPGLIDLLVAYKRALSNEQAFREGEFRDWRRFVQAAVPTVAGGGRVDILTAGQREPQERYAAYAGAVRGFDWLDFFHQWKGERFFDWLRSELVADAQGQDGAYDAVLVDSRTGITEMGGVCAYQLADVVVMLCAANEQNLDGTLRVARDFRSGATLALRRGRRLDLMVIPARLEAHNERRQDFLDQFGRTFDRTLYLPKQLYELKLDYAQLALPYDPAFAITEQIVGERAAQSGVASAAVRTFERLADALTLLAFVPGRLMDDQPAARRRILGVQRSEADPVPQLADPGRSAADFDFFLDEPRGGEAPWPSLLPGLRAAGLRVGALELDAQPDAELLSSVQPLVDASRALLIVFHREEVAPWTSALIDHARQLQRPIVPLVVASPSGSPGLRAIRAASLGHVNAVQLDERDPNSWVPAVVAALKQRASARESVAEPADAANPYPGSRAFGEADASLFFGRGSEIDLLANAVQSAETVVLFGPAGVGKSSLVCGGLLPVLRQRVGQPWRSLTIDFAAPQALQRDLDAWLGSLGADQGLVVLDSVDSLGGQPATAAAPGSGGAVDAVPSGADARARERIEAIGRILDRLAGKARVLLVLRHGFGAVLDGLAMQRWQWGPGQRRVRRFELQPMDGAALAQAIEKPAARRGHVVDPGVTTLLVAEAGTGPGAVSELARALPLLWQGRRRGWLTLSALEAAGGIAGLFRSAHAAFKQAASASEQAALRALVHTLSRLDTGMRWSCGSNVWEAVATLPALQAVDAIALRDQLAAAHFIDLWVAPAPKSDGPAPVLEGQPVQVALLPGAPRLYGDEHAAPFDAKFVLWRQRFESFVAAWAQSRRHASALLPAGVLAEAEGSSAEHQDLLTEPERSLIEESRRQLAREALRLEQRRRRIYLGLSAAAAVFLTLSLFAWVSRERAMEAYRVAESARAEAVDAQRRAESARQRTEAEQQRALAAEVIASQALVRAREESLKLKFERERADKARAAADAQSRIAEKRLEQIKTLLEGIEDSTLRSRLMAEYARGVTPELTKAQAAQLEAKTNEATESGDAGPRRDRPSGFRLWRTGSTLRMRLMGGNGAQHALVRAATAEWSKHANVRFEISDSPDAELRVAFKPEDGSWAYTGTDAIVVPRTQPTMNLGIADAASVLHEFGHVLGLIHEHQNPNANLPWNREAVYREMTGPPNYWPRAQVDDSILEPVKISNYREYDPDSIMHFSFEGRLFTDGRARGGKQVLSDSDRAFIAKLYPR